LPEAARRIEKHLLTNSEAGKPIFVPSERGLALRHPITAENQVSRIYWDTMLFIYWLEDHLRFGERAGEITPKMEKRSDQLIASSFTSGEALGWCISADIF